MTQQFEASEEQLCRMSEKLCDLLQQEMAVLASQGISPPGVIQAAELSIGFLLWRICKVLSHAPEQALDHLLEQVCTNAVLSQQSDTNDDDPPTKQEFFQ